MLIWCRCPRDSKSLLEPPLKQKQLQLITSPRLISWLGHRDLGESQHQIRSTSIGVMSEVQKWWYVTIQLYFIFNLNKVPLDSIHEKVIHVIMWVIIEWTLDLSAISAWSNRYLWLSSGYPCPASDSEAEKISPSSPQWVTGHWSPCLGRTHQGFLP